MITCTVHERQSEEPDATARAEQIVFVREGAAWWALFFPFVWLFYHRLWLVLVLYLAAVFTMIAIFNATGVPETVGGLATMALSVLLALEGNDLRRWKLARSGFRLVDVSGGRDMQECEQRFFENWIADQQNKRDGVPRMPISAGKTGAQAGRRIEAGDDVIGLFPEPGR